MLGDTLFMLISAAALNTVEGMMVSCFTRSKEPDAVFSTHSLPNLDSMRSHLVEDRDLQLRREPSHQILESARTAHSLSDIALASSRNPAREELLEEYAAELSSLYSVILSRVKLRDTQDPELRRFLNDGRVERMIGRLADIEIKLFTKFGEFITLSERSKMERSWSFNSEEEDRRLAGADFAKSEIKAIEISSKRRSDGVCSYGDVVGLRILVLKLWIMESLGAPALVVSEKARHEWKEVLRAAKRWGKCLVKEGLVGHRRLCLRYSVPRFFPEDVWIESRLQEVEELRRGAMWRLGKRMGRSGLCLTSLSERKALEKEMRQAISEGGASFGSASTCSSRYLSCLGQGHCDSLESVPSLSSNSISSGTSSSRRRPVG